MYAAAESTPNEIEITNSGAYGTFQNYYSVTKKMMCNCF